MKTSFERIIDDYLKEIMNQYKGNQLANHVRSELPNNIAQLVNLNEKYKVVGSVGQGNWGQIPWVAILDKEITTSAMKGY